MKYAEIALLVSIISFHLTLAPAEPETPTSPVNLRVMTWNIWHGGREDGPEVGPEKVTDIIRASGADIIAMQETYGSGKQIAQAIGFHLHARGDNVSIHSRYPIIEDISVHESFKCVGALIRLPDESRVAFYSIWLPYDAEIWERGSRDTKNIQSMLQACASSQVDLQAMYQQIERRLSEGVAGQSLKDVPIIIAGDFNSMSHLDYTQVARDQYHAAVDWPTSRVLIEAGFRDAYREEHPIVDRIKDRTWSPRFADQEQDRIDYIYFKGQGVRCMDARVIDTHEAGFPSDHAAVVAWLRVSEPTPKMLAAQSLQVVSYNIRHGVGMDQKLNLDRTAQTLKGLNPDLVALQEVDLRVKRSDSVNQAQWLGTQLGMYPAFGSFMEYQGGWYGLAILSRYPFVHVQSIELPAGNEPRVALAAELRLPDGEIITVVNVHYDWVDDDKYRHAQAAAVVEYLAGLKTPYILLGDFNDQPGSRTLKLFKDHAVEALPAAGDINTFPADAPRQKIDYIFASPATGWELKDILVVPENMASDHRPMRATLTRVREGKSDASPSP